MALRFVMEKMCENLPERAYDRNFNIEKPSSFIDLNGVSLSARSARAVKRGNRDGSLETSHFRLNIMTTTDMVRSCRFLCFSLLKVFFFFFFPLLA